LIKNNFISVIFFIIVSFSHLSAQTDWVRWERLDNYYLINYDDNIRRIESTVISKNDNSSENFAKTFVKFYKITISDFDGDNCRFNPSCSEFLAESMRLTNSFNSILLFFDRLTRDSNIFSSGKYKIVNNRFFDPPSEYIFFNSNSFQH